jgi:3-hydroxyacyl-[acyl-carrier-protein] dehydratase
MADSPLYTVLQYSFDSGKISARIGIHADHPVFSGHFPGQPVLPGVCQLAIVKELAERALNRGLVMQHADQVKFLAMVDPLRIPAFDVEIVFLDPCTVQALIREGELVFLKTKCTFVDA